MKKCLLAISAFALMPAVFAHPGHGNSDGYTITHYFTEPAHLLSLVLSVSVAVLLVRYFLKKEANR